MKQEFEAFRELLKADRSVRRFDSSVTVDENTLLQLVELTRYCASGRNAQPLRYRFVTRKEECQALYPLLAWAGYYKDWDGPEPLERPAAYLVQCLNTDFGPNCLCDDGLQLQAITLGATTLGLGCCIIKAFNAAKTSEVLHLPDNMQPRYVLAIGKPAETIVLEDLTDMGETGFHYYRDSEERHHVPKRKLQDLVLRG